jgi:hypothetical protein
MVSRKRLQTNGHVFPFLEKSRENHVTHKSRDLKM